MRAALAALLLALSTGCHHCPVEREFYDAVAPDIRERVEAARRSDGTLSPEDRQLLLTLEAEQDHLDEAER